MGPPSVSANANSDQNQNVFFAWINSKNLVSQSASSNHETIVEGINPNEAKGIYLIFLKAIA